MKETYAIVVKDFAPDMDGDLALKKGDIVTIKRNLRGWYEGCLLNGDTGAFPAENVRVMSDEDARGYLDKSTGGPKRTVPPVPAPPPPTNLPPPPPVPSATTQDSQDQASTGGEERPQGRRPLPPLPSGGGAAKQRTSRYVPPGAVQMFPISAPKDQEPVDDAEEFRGDDDDDHPAEYDAPPSVKSPVHEPTRPSRPLPPPPPVPSTQKQPPNVPSPPVPSAQPIPPLPNRSSTLSSVEEKSAPAPEQQDAEIPPSDSSATKPKSSKSGSRISRIFSKKEKRSKSKDRGHGDESAETHAQDSYPASTDSAAIERPTADSFEAESIEEHPPLPAVPSGEKAERRSSRSIPKKQLPQPPVLPPPAIPQSSLPSFEREEEDAKKEDLEEDGKPDASEEPQEELDSKKEAEDEPEKEEEEDDDDKDDDDDEEKEAKPNSDKPRNLAKVLKDYQGQGREELDLMEDDVVTVLRKGNSGDPRWKGEYHGKIGFFPGEYVELLTPSDETYDKEKEDKPKGFKLAAFGVKPGGIGSVFAGAGGMPTLRKTDRSAANRPPPKAPTAPVPMEVPVLRKTSKSAKEPKESKPTVEANKDEADALRSIGTTDQKLKVEKLAIKKSEQEVKSDKDVSIVKKGKEKSEPEPELEPEQGAEEQVEEEQEQQQQQEVEEEQAEDTKEDVKEVPETKEEPKAVESSETKSDTVDEDAEAKQDAPEDAAEAKEEPVKTEAKPETEKSAEPAEAEAEAKNSVDTGLEPIKPPAKDLKRKLLRPKKKPPTIDSLKQASQESQTRSLEEALEKDKGKPERNPDEPVLVQPVVPQKPKPGQTNRGIRLPQGGFEPTKNVSGGMMSRIAALQNRIFSNDSGNNDDEQDERSQSPPVVHNQYIPPKPVKRTGSTQSSTVDSAWQSNVDKQLAQLKADVAASNQATPESIAQKVRQDVVSPVEKVLRDEIQRLNSEVSTFGAQLQSVSTKVDKQKSNEPQLTESAIRNLIQEQVAAATKPLNDTISVLQKENGDLNKQIQDLRAYVDELTVEE